MRYSVLRRDAVYKDTLVAYAQKDVCEYLLRSVWIIYLSMAENNATHPVGIMWQSSSVNSWEDQM